MIEARFENGASLTLPDRKALGEPAHEAREMLASCMPPGSTADDVVAVSVLRLTGFCALCGTKLARVGAVVVTIELPSGMPTQTCGPCAGAAWRAVPPAVMGKAPKNPLEFRDGQ